MMMWAALNFGLLGEEGVHPHPVLSSDPSWVGALLIVVGGLFLAALAVGLVLRFNAPREAAPMPSLDEPPDPSRHHGRGD